MGDETVLTGNGARIISELFSDPVTFEETGGANKLLEEYQSGAGPKTKATLCWRSDA